MKNTSTNDMWVEVDPFHVPIFNGTMSRSRFRDILNYIRFDDMNTREFRSANDKLAAIREINDLMVKNCLNNFTPYEYVTIDEQMFRFKGKCNFKVYMNNKPDKHGLKTWILCDVKTHYVYNFQVYLGKQGKTSEKNQGKRVVLDLIKELPHGRGITCDNFFKSKSLAEELIARKFSLVGTVRKSRKEVPPALLPKKRPSFKSIYAFTKQMTLVSYAPKKNKTVLLLSTERFQVQNSNETHKKPEIILHYNSTKGSVDTSDQMTKNMSVRRGTRRWSFTIFMNIIDMVCLNGFVIWHTKYSD